MPGIARCRACVVHARETVVKPSIRTFTGVDVALVSWPSEQCRRELLREAGRPRLLVLEEDAATPPPPCDEMEDWIRMPAPDGDLRARLEALRRRAEPHQVPRPELDLHGVLRLDGTWVALAPVEARLAAVLVERYGAVVSREALARAGWPGGAPGRNALDVHMLRLRRRLAPLSLVLRTVRSRGYLMERVPGP